MATATFYAAVEQAARKLEARYRASADDARYPGLRGRFTDRANDLRHIASDARAAAEPEEPCPDSINSVDEWLEHDHELYMAVESYVPALASQVAV